MSSPVRSFNTRTAESRRRWSTVEITRWGGLNEDENPLAIGENELSSALNCWRLGSTLGTRPGAALDPDEYTTQIASGGDDAVQGVVQYEETDDTRHLLAIINGNVYRDDTPTIITKAGVTITAGQDNVWTFANHDDRIYGAGGADGDSLWYWDGTGAPGALTAVTFENAAAAAIDAKYVFQKWNYMFIAGMDGTAAEDNPMVVRYSALGDGTSWPVGNTLGGTSFIGGLSSYGGERITGLGEHTDNNGDWLLVMTNRALYPFVQVADPFAPFRKQVQIANGCVHQRAYVPLGTDSGDAVYLSHHGIHSLRQSVVHGEKSDRFLSWKIRNTFKTLNPARIHLSTGAYWPDQGVVVFAVSTGSNTTHDTLLVLDVRDVDELNADTARWYVWKLRGVNVNVLANVDYVAATAQSIAERSGLWLGSTNGDVARFTTTTYDDLGTAFEVRFRTKNTHMGQPGVAKVLGDILVHLQPGGIYQPQIKTIFDYGRGAQEVLQADMELDSSTSLWGSVSWGDGSKWNSGDDFTVPDRLYGSGVGEVLSFEFSHSGQNQPFRLASLSYRVRTLGESFEDALGATS